MLILTRKIGEKIHIGDQVTITVVSFRGKNVSLGIDAPKDTPIKRAELIDAEPGAPSAPTEPTEPTGAP